MWRVWCVSCVCVHVVLCCGVGGVCVVVLWWCVCVVCGEAWHTLSLSLLHYLSFLFFFLFSFPFFCSYLSSSLFFFLFLLLLPSLTLALALVLSLPLLSSFFPSTHSPLLVPSRQQTRRPTLRRLNVMWRTVRSQQLPTNRMECSHLSSSLLFSPPSSLPPTPRKKRGDFFLREYFRRGIYFLLQF